MILVVVLGVMWLAVLGPGYLRRRREKSRDGVTSVSVFHRQLRVLERSGPAPLPPAYRLRALPARTGSEEGGAGAEGVVEPMERPVLTVVGADRLPRPRLAFLGDPDPDPGEARGGHERGAGDHGDEPDDAGWGGAVGPEDRRWWTDSPRRNGEHRSATSPRRNGEHRSATANVDAYASAQACKRRRDVFVVLVSSVLGTLALGAIPGAHLLWIFTALAAVALGGYVALLVHMRMAADERDRKLRYLPPPAERYDGPAYGEAAYGGRRAGSAR
jgi:hypothetical protein